MQKNQLIDAKERITKEVTKPNIANHLPHMVKVYYVDAHGCVIFNYQEAIKAKESEKHNP